MANGADTIGLSASLAAALTARGTATAMRSKRYGLWQPISGADVVARAEAIARGLHIIGFQAGDVAAVTGDTCAEWVLADLGILAAGGIAAGLDAFASAEELARLVNLFGVSVLFVAGDDQLHKALRVRQDCPRLRQIVVMHEQWDDGAGADHVIPILDLMARGGAGSPLSQVAGHAIAAIIPTSGITAQARGAQLTQASLGKQAKRAAAALGLSADDERLSLTPLHHVLERVVGVYAALLAGCVVNFPESRETAFSDLVELQPTVVQAPPQVWARLKSGIELAAAEATAFQRRVLAASLKPGQQRAANPVADALVLSPIRRRIGLSRARLCLTGGAPLRADVAAWFAALRRPLTDIYGHAETGGAVSLAAYRGTRTTLEGVTLETTEAGEIRVRSDALFEGYAGEPASRPSDGWWRSGDVAMVNEAGLPHPAGRLDDLLDRASDGSAPFATEADLIASPYVADAFLYRDGQRTFAAILMNADAVVKYAQDHSIPFTHFLSLCRSADIRALIGRVVADTNSRAAVKIDDFMLIERALAAGDPEVSATLTLRRRLLRPTQQASLISESA